jgi:hypothetical protein
MLKHLSSPLQQAVAADSVATNLLLLRAFSPATAAAATAAAAAVASDWSVNAKAYHILRCPLLPLLSLLLMRCKFIIYGRCN